jgi:cold shock CspA family protein
MNTGKVVYYNISKAFGFIRDDLTQLEYYFNFKNCNYVVIRIGDRVTFKLIDSKNRPGTQVAVKINLII